MISREEFSALVVRPGSGIQKLEADELYWSVARTIALSILSKKQSESARSLEDKLQRRLISKINFAKIPKARAYFEQIRKKEAEIRQNSPRGYSKLIIERFVLESRLAIFSELLAFTAADAQRIDEFERELKILTTSEKTAEPQNWKIRFQHLTEMIRHRFSSLKKKKESP